MAETTAVEAAASANVEGKKSKKAASGSSGVKKPKSKPTHPPTAQMVNNAIKSLKERGGSSLPAIKKYLAANYKVDAEKLAPFIKKYLKTAVSSGKLIQTKGKGASGSFKLPSSAKAKSEGDKVVKKKKKTAVKKAGEKKPKEKAAKAEKKKVEKKKSAASAAKSAKKAGTPKVKTAKPKQQKPKKEKTAKAAPKTPKAPKPKKLAAPKKSAAKKVAKK